MSEEITKTIECSSEHKQMEHIGEAAKAIVIDTARKYVKRTDANVNEQRKALAQVAVRAIDDVIERMKKIMRLERNRSPDERTVQLAANFILGVDAFFGSESWPIPNFYDADQAGLYITDRAVDRAHDVAVHLLDMRWFPTTMVAQLGPMRDDHAKRIHEILDDLRDLNTPTIMWLRHMGVE